MKKIKLIATDVDNTMIDYYCKDIPSTIQKVKELKETDINLSYCTGRGIVGMKQINEIYDFDYLVGCNGAIVYDYRNKNIIFEKSLNAKITSELLQYIEENDSTWAIETKEEISFKNNELARDHYYSNGQGRYDFSFIQDYQGSVLKIIVLVKNDKVNKDILLNKFDNISITSMGSTMEIVAKGVNKWYSLNKLYNHLNIYNNEVMALGDSDNDKLMLENVPLSIAMGNATPTIKKISTYTTDDINDNGWSKAITKYLKEQERNEYKELRGIVL